jgi:antitoxin YefM
LLAVLSAPKVSWTAIILLYIMLYMAHASFTELRQHMASFFDRVTADREPLHVSRAGGKGNLVVMSEEEFAGWQETVHLLSSPKNATRLMESIHQARAGGARERKLVMPETA